MIFVAPRAAFLRDPLETVEPNSFVAQKATSRGHILSTLRPSEFEHVNRFLYLSELLSSALHYAGRDGGQVGSPSSDGRLSSLDLIPGRFDVVAKPIRGGENLIRLLLSRISVRNDFVPGMLVWFGCIVEELVDLGLERLIIEHQLQVLHAALVDPVAGIHGAEERPALGVMRVVADVALHIVVPDGYSCRG